MKRHFFYSFYCFLLCTAALTACRPASTTTDPEAQDSLPVNGDWIRINHSSDPDGLAPYSSRTGPATAIKENMHLSLATYNAQTLQSEPALVTGPAQISADGLRFTYEMRPEARWDHGDPITGHDYAFSVKCMKNSLTDNAQMRSIYAFISDVQVDPQNDRRFTVVTSEPFFLGETFIADFDILSRKFFDSLDVLGRYSVADFTTQAAELAKDPAMVAFFEGFNSDKYATDPAYMYGAGAYKVESWTPGDNVTLVRKQNWWGDQLRGKGYVFQCYAQKLIFKTIKDKSTFLAAARNGELDVVQDLPPDDFIAAREDTAGSIAKHFYFHTPTTYTLLYLGFNCKPSVGRRPVLEDVRVRKAVAHLTDIQTIIAKVYNGFGTPQISCISPLKTDELDPKLQGYAFDPGKAKALLDEAGWIDSDADGLRDKMVQGKRLKLEIELLFSNASESGASIARMLADQAIKVGMLITPNPLVFATLNDRMRDHDFDMVINGISGSPLPTDLEQLWASENWANGGMNFFGFGDTTTDALIDQIRQTISASDRVPLYHKFEALWLAQLPMLPLFAPQSRLLIDKRYRNALPTTIKPGFRAFEFWTPLAAQKFK